MSEETTAESTADTPDAVDELYDESSEGGTGTGDTTALQAQLEAANRRADAEHDAFLRARADYQNFKRRTEEEKASLKQYLTEDLITRLLPIVDNFERALQASEQTKDYEKLIGGVNAVYRQMQDYLTREGVSAIEALYQPFDPNVHNAVLREETTEYPENTVVEELQKGYRLGDKVLRPTMVKVSTGDE